MNISLRLKTVACMLKYHECVADIGCDHGYLSIYLIENKLCEHVLAMDLRKEPLNKAINNIKEYSLSDKIETRLSDGLAMLAIDEAQSVCIAGMGGPLIIKILSEANISQLNIKEFVISPQSEIDKVRKYLNSNNFIIDNEDMIYEDEKYYNILHLSIGRDEEMTETEYKYGKILLNSKNKVLYSYLIKEQKKLISVFKALLGLDVSDSVIMRKNALQSEIRMVEEALKYYEM